MPGQRRQADGTTRGPSRHFIPGTNSIESLNYQLRKIIKNRGHFSNDDDAAVKLLYLALRNMNPHRGGDPGTSTYGWKQALNAFAIYFPGRLPIQPPMPAHAEHLTGPTVGEGKPDAKDTAIIADQARMRRDLRELRGLDDDIAQL